MKIQNNLTKFILSNLLPCIPVAVRLEIATNCMIHARRTLKTSATLGMPNLRHPLIWRVDWLLVQSGQYALVDPEAPGSILYVTKKEYLKLLGIAESNDMKLTVLAVPYDAKPKDETIEVPKPENSPPIKTVGEAMFWRGMLSRISRSYRAFMSPRSKMFESTKVPKYLNGLVKRWALALGQWTSLPLTSRGWFRDLTQVIPYLLHIVNTQGTTGLVLLMKNSSLFIQQYLAGTPKSSEAYGHRVKLACGLPAWLPLHARMAIRQRSYRVIRFWLSILYIYKVIEMPHKIHKALDNVTRPVPEFSLAAEQLLESYRQFLRTVFVPKVLGGKLKWPSLKTPSFFCPVSAGPNGAPAINNVHKDLGALVNDHLQAQGTKRKSLLTLILSIMGMFGHHVSKLSFVSGGVRYLDEWETQRAEAKVPKEEPKPLRHSRVHILGEPAGKLRPIAIFDIFTQRALKPLHDTIFKALEKLPQDGTHSQVNLMKWLKEQANTAWSGQFWSSLDISAATDSIPLKLYQILLEEVFGHTALASVMASEVLALMTDRDFYVTVDSSVSCTKEEASKLPETVRYGTGQPMGCLGSFALLALWNHSWVQFASWLVTGKTISSYGVTGDDVVISESSSSSPIGKKYVEISNMFGISISLPKSFLSSHLFNFLSRTWLGGEEISPASIREDVHIRDTSTRTQRALRLLDRDWWNCDGNGWLAKAMKYFLYPSELLHSMTFVKRGKLDGYGLRSVLAFLSPSRSISAAVGLSGAPIFGWLSAFAGSTVLLAHGDKVRNDSILPRGIRYDSAYGILQDLMSLILRQIIDVYQFNKQVYECYETWWSAQVLVRYLPEDVADLFLPSASDFLSMASPQIPFGDIIGAKPEQKVVQKQWLSLDTNYGYTNMELVAHLGSEWWTPQNIRLAITRGLEWLGNLEKSRDFRDPDLFSHQASMFYSKRVTGEREFNAHERNMLSLLYLFSSSYPGEIDLGINAKMVSYLEGKFLSKFLGYQVSVNLGDSQLPTVPGKSKGREESCSYSRESSADLFAFF